MGIRFTPLNSAGVADTGIKGSNGVKGQLQKLLIFNENLVQLDMVCQHNFLFPPRAHQTGYDYGR
jgi:hypothetical protein